MSSVSEDPHPQEASSSLRETMLSEHQLRSLYLQAKDHAFDYADGAAERNVFPTPEALASLQAHFVEPLPQRGGDASAILRCLHEHGSPASTAQSGGRYFGFVNGGVLPVTLATKWLTDFWDQNCALHLMSPVASKLEQVCESWLRELFALPAETVAGFVSGTSSAILCGLAAARFRLYQRLDYDFNRRGHCGAPPLRVVAGRHTHSAVLKAAALLGFGTDCIEWVDVDTQGRIKPTELPALDATCIVLLQAGNVNSGSFDPFREICEAAAAAGAWVHIDGAFGLWAGGTRRLAHLTDGMQLAHSWSVDAHKTLNTPYDCGILLCRDKEALTSALQSTGAYLHFGNADQERDGMRYTQEMSRRARAVELWAALKYLGRDGVDELIYGLYERATQFAAELSTAGFTVHNDVVFNQVVVSLRLPPVTVTAADDGDGSGSSSSADIDILGDAEDEATMRLLAQVQASGECWVGSSVWFGRKVIRVSVCSWVTSAEDVSRSVRAFAAAKAAVSASVSVSA